MVTFERILCSLDFSEFSECAYGYAESIARHFQSKFFVQHVIEMWRHPAAAFGTPEGYAEMRRYLLDDCAQDLRDFLRDNSRGDVCSNQVLGEGIAPDAILEFAEAEHVDLIVMGTHGRRGLDRLMLGSVTERVVRTATRPVLTVHGQICEANRPVARPGSAQRRHILFCTDLSDRSRRPLEYACSLAAEYGAQLTLVNVVECMANSTARETAMSSARERLDGFIPPGGGGAVAIRRVVREGKPYEQIIALAAEEESNLVVMGVHGAIAMDLLVFGSTTHRVIQLGPCPVLVVQV